MQYLKHVIEDDVLFTNSNPLHLSQEIQIFVITNIYFQPVFTDFINMAEPSTSTVSIYLHNYQFK